jgi:DnaJ like chaperone protein
MSYWGKLLGGMAGFAVGGPFGAVMGAAFGHAADSGALPHIPLTRRDMHPVRIAAMFASREQVFAMGVVALSAKLAKCDGPVTRAEIDAFRRAFRVPPENAREVGRLFDQARDSPDDFEPYAKQLGVSFTDNRAQLEDVLAALFSVARADGPVNDRELDFLARVATGFGVDGPAWERARAGTSRARTPTGMSSTEPDPYATLGVARNASSEAIRAAWKRLMRENHPDSLASQGAAPSLIERASAKVATINAAWDRVKRERGL